MPDIEEWVAFFASPNPAIKLRAARALLKRPDEAPLSILLDILDNLSRQGLGFPVRQVLRERKDAELLDEMIARLNAEDSVIRDTVCDVLGSLGVPAALPHLIAMIDDSDVSVRRTAAFAVGFLGDPAAIPALERQLEGRKNDDINVVWGLRSSLERLGKPPGEGESVTDRPK